MARSLNKAQLIGRLGRDPEVRKFSNGGSVVTFPVATTDQWKDRSSGERREKTEWHRVAIFSEPIGRIAEQYLRKGDQVYIEGKMETRKWTDQSGQERFMTEVVIRPYGGEMTLLGGGSRDGSGAGQGDRRGQAREDHGGARGHERPLSGFGGGPSYGDERSDANDGRYENDGYSGQGYGGGRSGGRFYDDDIPF